MLAFFISILYVCESGIWCGNNECSYCLNGYRFYTALCLAQCPTGYTENELEKRCIQTGSLLLSDMHFMNPYSFDTTSIGGFSTSDGLPFTSDSNNSPIITKDRGLYFSKNSTMIANPGWVLSPLTRVSYYIRVFQPGKFFEVLYKNLTLMSVYSNMNTINHSFLLFEAKK